MVEVQVSNQSSDLKQTARLLMNISTKPICKEKNILWEVWKAMTVNSMGCQPFRFLSVNQMSANFNKLEEHCQEMQVSTIIWVIKFNLLSLHSSCRWISSSFIGVSDNTWLRHDQNNFCLKTFQLYKCVVLFYFLLSLYLLDVLTSEAMS